MSGATHNRPLQSQSVPPLACLKKGTERLVCPDEDDKTDWLVCYMWTIWKAIGAYSLKNVLVIEGKGQTAAITTMTV